VAASNSIELPIQHLGGMAVPNSKRPLELQSVPR
jgi:hypothetical protein